MDVAIIDVVPITTTPLGQDPESRVLYKFKLPSMTRRNDTSQTGN